MQLIFVFPVLEYYNQQPYLEAQKRKSQNQLIGPDDLKEQQILIVWSLLRFGHQCLTNGKMLFMNYQVINIIYMIQIIDLEKIQDIATSKSMLQSRQSIIMSIVILLQLRHRVIDYFFQEIFQTIKHNQNPGILPPRKCSSYCITWTCTYMCKVFLELPSF